MSREEIIDWYNNSNYNIKISQNNRSKEYEVILYKNDLTFVANHNDMHIALLLVKDMVGGEYRK